MNMMVISENNNTIVTDKHYDSSDEGSNPVEFVLNIPPSCRSFHPHAKSNQSKTIEYLALPSSMNELMSHASVLHVPFSECFTSAVNMINTIVYPTQKTIEGTTDCFYDFNKSMMMRLKNTYDDDVIYEMDWVQIMSSEYHQNDDDVKTIEINVAIEQNRYKGTTTMSDRDNEDNYWLDKYKQSVFIDKEVDEYDGNGSGNDKKISIYQNLENVIRFIELYGGGFCKKKLTLTPFEKTCKQLFITHMTCENIISPANVDDTINGYKLYTSGSINKRLFYKCIDAINLNWIDVFKFYQFMTIQYQTSYIRLNIPLEKSMYPIIHGFFILKPHVVVSNIVIGLCKILGISILYYNETTDSILHSYRKDNFRNKNQVDNEGLASSLFYKIIYTTGVNEHPIKTNGNYDKKSSSYHSIYDYSDSNLVNQVKCIMKRMCMDKKDNVGDLDTIYGFRKKQMRNYLNDVNLRHQMNHKYRLGNFYDNCHQWNEKIMVIYENHFIEYTNYYLGKINESSLVDIKSLKSFVKSESFKKITMIHLPNELKNTFDNLLLDTIFPTVVDLGVINGMTLLISNGNCKLKHIKELRYYIYSIIFEALKWRLHK